MVVGGQRGMERQEKWRMSTVSPARVMSLSRSPLLTTSAAGSWHGNCRGEPFPGRFGRECEWRLERKKKRQRDGEMEDKSRRQKRRAHGSLTSSVLLWQRCQFTPHPHQTHKRSSYPLWANDSHAHTRPFSFVMTKVSSPITHTLSHARTHARTHTHFPKGPSLFLSVKMKTYIKFYHSINQSYVHTVLIGSQRGEL